MLSSSEGLVFEDIEEAVWLRGECIKEALPEHCLDVISPRSREFAIFSVTTMVRRLCVSFKEPMLIC
jgi:hypothetical protein